MTVESRSVVVRLSAETAQYIREMQKAGTVGADAMSKVQKSSMSASQAQDQLAGGAGKIGLAAAAGFGLVVNAAAGFDQAMSKVQAATHETEAGMESLRAAALEAGADTAFSAEEAAAGIESLAKAGLSTQDILDGGLTGALDLAAAGEMQVADAAEAAAGALAQFKLDGDQAAHVADLLAAGAGKAQGDVSDMVMALKQGGTVASQTGLSLEETVGALSAMAEQSLLGSDAGTSFKTMLAALTPNSTKAASAMADYNIQAFDAQGNFVGMTELAGQLQAGLGGLTDEQRAMALETIFGSDAVRAASIIYDNGATGIANWTAKVNDAGFAAETAAIKQDNLRGDIEKLGGALSTALIGSGDGSQGFLRSITQGLTSAVDAYTKLPSAAQGATTTIMAGAAAIGGSIWVGSKLVQGIANTREALDALEASGSRAGTAMKGLAIAGAALAGLTAAVAGIKAIQEAAEESLPGVEGMTSRLLDLSTLGEQGFSVSLGKEFDSLGESIDRVADPGRITAASDGFLKLFTLDGAEIDGARQEVELLDQALAKITSTSGTDAAEGVLSGLVDQGYLTESQLKKVRGELTQYDEAVSSAANQTKLEAAAAADAEGATSALGGAMADAAEETESFKDMIDRLNGVLGVRAAARDYEASIDDFTKALKKNGNTFDINTEKGRENQSMLDNIAGSALSVAESLDGAARKRFLTNAIDDIRTMGKQMGLPKGEIRKLIELLREANNADVNPSIDVQTGNAMGQVQALRNSIEALRDRQLTITTVYKVVRNAADAMPYRGKADGGQILGPGTTTSDSIPAWLSNKEYVIKAAAVDHYGVGFFDDVNAMRLAEGGSADKKKRKKPPTRTVEFEEATDFGPSEAAQQQAADAAARYYETLEQQAYEQDERAKREAEIAEAVLEGQQRAWDMATDAAKAQVDAAQAMRDSVEANMEKIGQAATDQFQSQLFAQRKSGLSVGGSGSGWRGTLEGDIAGLRERSSLLTQLSSPGLGLSAEALETLLREADNSQIRDMLAAGEVDDYAAMFAERARLTGAVSGQAGMAGYGNEWTAASAQLVQSNQHLARIEAAIAAARPITILQTTTEAAAAAELARLLGNF